MLVNTTDNTSSQKEKEKLFFKAQGTVMLTHMINAVEAALNIKCFNVGKIVHWHP